MEYEGQGTRFEVKADLATALIRSRPPRNGGEALFVPTGGRFPVQVAIRDEGARRGGGRDEYALKKGLTRDGSWKKGEWLSQRLRRSSREASPFAPETWPAPPSQGLQTVQGIRQTGGGGDHHGKRAEKGTNGQLQCLSARRPHPEGRREVLGLYTADDVEEEISRVVEGLGAADLFILTGGTSRGKKDLTRQALRASRGRVLLDAPPVMPGKSMTFGRKGAAPFFILPGNPRAIRTLYEVFIARGLLCAGRQTPAEDRSNIGCPCRVTSESPGNMIAVDSRALAVRTGSDSGMRAPEPNGFICSNRVRSISPAGATVQGWWRHEDPRFLHRGKIEYGQNHPHRAAHSGPCVERHKGRDHKAPPPSDRNGHQGKDTYRHKSAGAQGRDDRVGKRLGLVKDMEEETPVAGARGALHE